MSKELIGKNPKEFYIARKEFDELLERISNLEKFKQAAEKDNREFYAELKVHDGLIDIAMDALFEGRHLKQKSISKPAIRQNEKSCIVHNLNGILAKG